MHTNTPGRLEGLEFQRETRFPGRNGEPVNRPLPPGATTAPVVLAVYGPSAHVSEAMRREGYPTDLQRTSKHDLHECGPAGWSRTNPKPSRAWCPSTTPSPSRLINNL